MDQKLKWAKAFGATHTIHMNGADVVASVMEITRGEGVDYAFEVISSPTTIGQAFAVTSKLGVVVVIGLTPATVESLPISPLQLVLSQKTPMGTLYGASNPQFEIPRALWLYKHGQIKLDELITRWYRLDQVNEGYAGLLAGKNIRGVLTFA